MTVQIRIGLNSGEVVTRLGADGQAPAAGQFLVSGDVVNVASRLQGAAEPGEVLVGPRTYLAARHAFAFGDETQLELKGKSAPVAARRLLRALPELQRGVPGLEAPMIGRDRELDLLSGLLDEAIEVDRPRLVTIYGAAGIGKSRLLRELIARVDGHQPPITVLRGRCLAAGQRVTFWALAEWLRSVTATSLADRSGSRPAARRRARPRDPRAARPAGRRAGRDGRRPGADRRHRCTETAAPTDARRARSRRPWPARGRASPRGSPAAVRRCSWSRTSTGRTTRCSTCCRTSPRRAQGAILLVLTARPEFAESHPGFAANAEATGHQPPTADRCAGPRARRRPPARRHAPRRAAGRHRGARRGQSRSSSRSCCGG